MHNNYEYAVHSPEDFNGVFKTNCPSFQGFVIGIMAVKLNYPKLPGNVANASTYPFGVLYRVVDFEIERLFSGDPSIKDDVINAAKELEKAGVKAIIGACGYFAHFQKDVATVVNIPVFMSSLCQLPVIKTAISPQKRIAVFAASGENINDDLLTNVGTDSSRLSVINIGKLQSFEPIRYGKKDLDNKALVNELCHVAHEASKDKSIGAILLECSDLPPYAFAIQEASGLPVFDFNTMTDMVYHAISQKMYRGCL